VNAFMKVQNSAGRIYDMPVGWWFLLDFIGMKLFAWYASIPWYPLSASRDIELLMSFPIVSF
jgi:hypothetical protein